MGPARAQMQDWSCFVLYLSSDVWTILETTDGRYNQLSKVDRVADWLCCELGLRNPSELTLATVAALISMYDPAGEQLRQSPEQQLALLQTVRSRFRAMTTRARTAGRTVLLQLSSLPSNTAAIPLAARQARFPDGFVAPRVALQTLWATRAVGPCGRRMLWSGRIRSGTRSRAAGTPWLCCPRPQRSFARWD